jgi:hypothetical protein
MRWGVGLGFFVLSLGTAQAKCVKEPPGNETICGYEARMAVARRHGFADLAHGDMSIRIYNDPKLSFEAGVAAEECRQKHNFCK